MKGRRDAMTDVFRLTVSSSQSFGVCSNEVSSDLERWYQWTQLYFLTRSWSQPMPSHTHTEQMIRGSLVPSRDSLYHHGSWCEHQRRKTTL